MFISKLIHTIEQYDPYALHRLNGIKVVYVFFALCAVNLLRDFPSVYFYYFYVPITAMSAEMLPTRIPDKFKALTITMLGSCVLIFLFNLLKPYPLFFIIFGFFSALFLYAMAKKYFLSLIQIVPIILGLGCYSLVYPSLNANLHLILINAGNTLFALCIMLSALLFFPLSLYYRLWRRALILLLTEIVIDLQHKQRDLSHPLLTIEGHTHYLLQFALCLPRSFPTISVLKINLLANRLRLFSSSQLPLIEQQMLITRVQALLHAIRQEQPCQLMTDEPLLCRPIMKAWNSVCSNH